MRKSHLRVYIVLLAASLNAAEKPIDIESRRELFVEQNMTQKMFSLELQLHHQVHRKIVLTADVLHERLTTFVGCDEIGGDDLFGL